MSNQRACCCDPVVCPVDCCEFWDCPAVTGFPPTSITISGTFQWVRTWNSGAAGQTEILEEYTWSIVSSGAFVAIGANCLLSDFGYGVLNCTLNYSHKVNYWVPNVGDNSITGGVLAIPEDCAGCLEDAWRCRTLADIVFCNTLQEEENLTSHNIYNVDGVLRYVCSDSCDTLCAAPRIVFDPDPLTRTGTITYRYDCCDATPDATDPASIILQGWEIIGLGGCPSAKSWIRPRIHCSSFPGVACAISMLNPCANLSSCDEITGETTLASGSETYNWLCYDNDAKPAEILECSVTIEYTDKCVSTISVSVT